MSDREYAVPHCSVCVHGYDLDPRDGSMVVCTPQHKAHDPHYCCTGFRRITLAEIDERTAAKFGKPNAPLHGRGIPHHISLQPNIVLWERMLEL